MTTQAAVPPEGHANQTHGLEVQTSVFWLNLFSVKVGAG